MSQNIVHIENLVKRYGELTALNHLNLDIREGEIFGLLGPNGSGKTTAINCMLSLLKYEKGQIEIFGEPTVAVDPQSRNKILEGIKQLNEQGSTIIYTSHYMEEVEQICTRVAIMDHGRIIASGTKDELKQMIKTGETITIEAVILEENNLKEIRELEHVFDIQYRNQILTVRCTRARHNLIRILNYLQNQDIAFGRVFSEMPTLNDVFLEITGKQLRD